MNAADAEPSATPPPGARVALVTGATGGIGRAIALKLAGEGWDVAIAYRASAERGRGLCAEIEASGRRAVALEADLEAAEDCSALPGAAAVALGGLDALVHSAGTMAPAALLEARIEDVDREYAVNARAGLLLAQAAAERIREADADGGRIVFVTSKAAAKAVRNLAGYGMSKAALKMLTEVAAIELAPLGITVNAVAPATVETDLNRDLLADPEFREQAVAAIPLARLGAPGDVAGAVAFLLSEDAAFVTGATIAVDGGAGV